MTMKRSTKGLLYAFAALIFISTWPIFLKLGYQEFTYQTTATMWFLSSTVYSLVLVLFTGKLGALKKAHKDIKYILIFGVINFAAIVSSWYALTLLDPGIYSFLFQISVLVVVLSGVLYLKERFNYQEGLSGTIVVFGVLLLTFTKGQVAILGLLLILIHAVGFSIYNIIIKKKLNHVPSMVLTFARALMLGVFFLIYSNLTGTFHVELKWSILLITVPSLFSGVLGQACVYAAYKNMDMAKTQLILVSQPVVALVVSFFVFGEMFSPVQYLAGLLVVGGLAALSLFHAKK